jgi:hypothetical protein
VLQKMVGDWGTTPTIVSNWLINARRRKWRSAIMQAFDLNRPAEFLLEDLITIFLGSPMSTLESNVERSRHG